MRGPVDFLRVVLLGDGWLLEAWLVLGGILAAPVFASSVVAIPMLLDRDESLAVAVYTSWRVVMEDPGPMAVWAGLILLLTLLGMATAFTGPGGHPALAGARQLACLPRPGRAACERLMFGYTEEQIAWFGLTFGVGAFMLYMVFIIFQLARESKAGRFGTFVLFLALGFGLIGFVAKGVIKYFIAGAT